MKAPSHGKQSNQSNTAKTTSSALTGNSSSLAPAPIISIDPSRTDDQAATSQTKVPLADDEPNSFYDDGDGGVALPKAKEVEHEISSNPQVLSSRKPSLELASPSNPRRKEKVILNHTSTGWVAISEKEEAERILAESKLSLEPKEGSLLELKAIEEGGVTVNDQPENDVIPEQRHEDVKSSPAQWQAYANASTSFQVSPQPLGFFNY